MRGAARALPRPATRFVEPTYRAQQLMGSSIDMRRGHSNVVAEAIDLFTRELVGFVHDPTYHAFFHPLIRLSAAFSWLFRLRKWIPPRNSTSARYDASARALSE